MPKRLVAIALSAGAALGCIVIPSGPASAITVAQQIPELSDSWQGPSVATPRVHRAEDARWDNTHVGVICKITNGEPYRWTLDADRSGDTWYRIRRDYKEAFIKEVSIRPADVERIHDPWQTPGSDIPRECTAQQKQQIGG